MDMFEYAKGLARHTDPQTSQEAASLVNATKGEKVVYETLMLHGPMTMEEVGLLHNKPSDHLGPRFASLRDKNMIDYVYDFEGKIKTRPGRSGRQRQVFCIQPNKSLWRKKTQKSTKIQELEAEISRLTSILDFNRIEY